MEPFADDPGWDAATRARAYQVWEISLIGERDPAEVQAEQPAQLRGLTKQAGSVAAARPSSDEWSPAEIVAHLLDTEIIYAARYRYMVAFDDPPLIGYEPDLLMARLHAHPEDDDLPRLLNTFTALRHANVELWRSLSDEERARNGIHQERGPESVGVAFRQVAGHGVLHLDQMRRAIDLLKTSPQSQMQP